MPALKGCSSFFLSSSTLFGIAVAGEVLERADHAAVPKALYRGFDKRCRLCEVVGIGAVADDGVVGIAQNVRDGSIVHIEADRAEVGGDDLGVVMRDSLALILVFKHRLEGLCT